MTQIPSQGSNLQPHRGVLILVFGILGLLVCVIFGIAAWVMGNTDLRAMQAGIMDPSGEGLTKAGKILGMIATILTIVVLVLWLVVVLLGVGAAVSSGTVG